MTLQAIHSTLRGLGRTASGVARWPRWVRRAYRFARPILGPTLPALDSEALARRVDALGPDAPTIGVIVPVYRTPPSILRACIASVTGQAYPGWRLYLVDDGSPAGRHEAVLRQAQARDARIVVLRRDTNGGISAATNDGIDAASEPILVFLDHDDALARDALLEVAEAFSARPDLDVAYSDQVKIDDRGAVVEHFFKPDWSPVYLLGAMYVGHLLAVRTELARRLRFQSRFDGVQDFELMLRLSETTDRIAHIARPLYAWRAIAGSLARGSDEKRGIEALQLQAVSEHLARRGRTWRVESHPTIRHRALIRAGAETRRPSVTAIVPTRDQPELVERCLSTLRNITRYPDLEIIVVDNGTTDPAALASIAAHADRRIAYDRPFNFSEANNLGAQAAKGELLLFLNNDTEVIEPDWLSDLAAFLEEPTIGVVGPTLLYPGGAVQHAGVVLGARGTADHVMRHFRPDWDGYGGSLAVARDVTAVTAACALMRASLFREIGGFSTDFRKHYQDVDLCLRARERGFDVICASHVRLIHHESVTRAAGGYDLGDRAILVDRWWEAISAGDPFYNRNLDAQGLRYEPLPKALGARAGWRWRRPISRA